MANYDTSKLAAAYNQASPVFHAPRGNSKTGTIPAFNLLPGVTCSADACSHCLKEGCYAVKNCFRAGYDPRKNGVLRSWAENTKLAKTDLSSLEAALDAYFSSMAAPRFFRIHAAGDFFSVEYARMWFRIALKHKETRFLAFTKQWDVVRHVPFSALDNFSLVLSGWTGCRVPDDMLPEYSVAWCDDGQETRIPADALECPGDCDTCGFCWNLASMEKDVYFHKH